MIEKGYTNEQLAERIYDREMIKQLICRHSYYLSNGQAEQAISELWVTDPVAQRSAALGYNNGWYIGIEEIRRHLVDDYNGRVDGKKGVMEMNTITTPLVYISDDGKSARYLGYRLGCTAEGKPDGSADAYMDFGLVRADLVCRDGDWRLLHMVLEHDHTVTVGEDYNKVPVKLPAQSDPLYSRFGNPTLEETVYDPFYGWEYMWSDMPRPYETYSERESCGPNGLINKPYYMRERR